MCGRFTLKTPVIDWLCSLFPSDRGIFESLASGLRRANPLMAAPRYNISPTQPIWGITQSCGDPMPPGREWVVQGYPIRMLRWGLIPPWADSTRVAYSMINARSETLLEKPSFKNLIRNHRCVIVADGYYEWKRPPEDTATGHKQPYWIYRPGEQPFAMAGLWTENRKVQPSHVLESATIVTTEANSDTSGVHDRMPVLLPDSNAIDHWLAADTTIDEITSLLIPALPGFLRTRAVSSQVNSPRHDGPHLIEPIADSDEPG